MEKEVKLKQGLLVLATRMRTLRKGKFMTQRKVADLMNIEEASYQRIERGATNPTFKTMFLFALALDIEMKDLFEVLPDTIEQNLKK